MDKGKNIRNLTLSSVTNYDNNNFIFLVHTFSPEDDSIQNLHLLEMLKIGGKYDLTQDIDLSKTPERIKEKHLISCSLIAKKGYLEYLEAYKPLELIIKCSIEIFEKQSFEQAIIY